MSAATNRNQRCPECRFANGSCRQFVIGHPNPTCLAGYPQQQASQEEGLAMLIPSPRRSPENVGVR
ncbi:hypothetical protein [Actinophytocola sp.]|uniref:hypothetical protein n=1 Tax=Actinophytocola sp. TaxID=1872138 RepID=UPI00389A526A